MKKVTSAHTETLKILVDGEAKSNSPISILEFFIEFPDKNICHYSKGLEPVTSCVRGQDATTATARHMWEAGSLNWAQFMLQWFMRFPEFADFNKSSAPFRKNSESSAPFRKNSIQMESEWFYWSTRLPLLLNKYHRCIYYRYRSLSLNPIAMWLRFSAVM